MKGIMKYLAALILSLTLFTTSCSTVNTQAKVLASTVLTVDAAVKGWHTYVVMGGATPEQDAKVAILYSQYQAVESMAEKALIASIKTGDKSFFKQAQAQLDAIKVDLINMIETFRKEK